MSEVERIADLEAVKKSWDSQLRPAVLDGFARLTVARL
jgi:hypothetical protein